MERKHQQALFRDEILWDGLYAPLEKHDSTTIATRKNHEMYGMSLGGHEVLDRKTKENVWPSYR